MQGPIPASEFSYTTIPPGTVAFRSRAQRIVRKKPNQKNGFRLDVIIVFRSGTSAPQQAYAGFSFLHRRAVFVGEWLSLVEHLVRDQGVGGSNPLSPTILFKHVNSTSGFPS